MGDWAGGKKGMGVDAEEGRSVKSSKMTYFESQNALGEILAEDAEAIVQ